MYCTSTFLRNVREEEEEVTTTLPSTGMCELRMYSADFTCHTQYLRISYTKETARMPWFPEYDPLAALSRAVLD